MRAHLSALSLPLARGTSLRVSAVERAEGSASLVWSRGRARPGYELTVALRWTLHAAAAGAPAASGSAGFDGVSDSEGDDVWAAWRLVVDEVADGAAAADAIGACAPPAPAALAAALRGRADDWRGAFRAGAATLRDL